MIENLNKQSFALYGRILCEGFPTDEGWERCVMKFRSGQGEYYRCESELYLTPTEGRTILLLRRKGKTAAFHLDKAVCLPAETEYALLPYQESCSVELCYQSQPQSLEPCVHENTFKISDTIHLGEIYTLHYWENEAGALIHGAQHDAFELIYVDKGQLHCAIDGKGYLLKQGQLIICGPKQWLTQYTDPNMTAHSLTASFDLSSNTELPLLDRVFDLSSSEAVYLKQLLREPEIQDLYSNDMIRCNLKLLLLSILRSANERRKRLKTPTVQRNEGAIVGRAMQYVADHVRERMTVESVAKETGVSASHLTALFHRQMQLSPGEYIRRVKLEESKTLIRKGELNFSQIAEALSYTNIHHFSRQFKEHFGISPTEYAKSLSESSPSAKISP